MPGNESEIVDDSSDVASENEYDAREEHDEDGTAGRSAAQNGGGEGRETKKPKLDPKDPLRPRRKKARRACFACQRAHLTCGMFSHVIIPSYVLLEPIAVGLSRIAACTMGR
jgi:hypothetical protein